MSSTFIEKIKWKPDRDHLIPKAKYTLKRQDYTYQGRTYRSLYQLYMEMEDTTEYEFAMKYFGSWDEWKRLVETKWFSEHIHAWREELALKLEARHLQKLRDTALSEGREAVNASKYLLDKAKQQATVKPGRGRPSNKPSIPEDTSQIAMDLKLLEGIRSAKLNRTKFRSSTDDNRRNQESSGSGPGDLHSVDTPEPSTGSRPHRIN